MTDGDVEQSVTSTTDSTPRMRRTKVGEMEASVVETLKEEEVLKVEAASSTANATQQWHTSITRSRMQP